MNIKRKSIYEDSLASEAWHNLESCCETLCDKDTVIQYILFLEHKIKKLEDEKTAKT